VAAQNFFGLDIGTSSIKVVQLTKVKQGAKLLAAGAIPSPGRGMLTESPVEQEAICEAIKKIVHEARVSTNRVVSALAESQIFTRVIEMPVLTDRELTSAIKWEADQHLPVPISEVSLAWQVLARPEKITADARMLVLLIAAPLSLVEKHLKILEAAGLKSEALETENLALTRALVDQNSPTTLILSIGAFTTDICIARAGVLVSTRSIATGGNLLTRAISSELDFEIAQAEEYKKTYGLLEEQLEGKVFAALRPVMEIIVGEVRKTVTTYQSRFPDDAVKQMILAGGGAKLPGIVVYLAQAFGMEVQIGDPWYNLIKDHTKEPEIGESRPIFTIATGLARRGL